MTSNNNQIGTLGVLVPNKHWRKLSKQRAHYRLKGLAEANEHIKFNLFFFSVNKVDVKNQKINGIYYDAKDDQWKKGVFPYPDILYRRGGATRKYREQYRTFKKQCKKINTIFLNPSSFGNWDIYHYFNKVSDLEDYLQETLLYKKPSDLIDMVNRHRTIYLKGQKGRKGKNVLRVEKLQDNDYRYWFHNEGLETIESKEFTEVNNLVNEVQQFYKGREFMIQEAIDLLELDGKRVDLRAELQRNRQGDIQITCISARIGKTNSPITTLASASPIEDLFNRLTLSHNKQSEILYHIEKFLFLVYYKIEKKYGACAEMGIDFALTKDFQVRFIECNSQSTKVSLLKAYGEEALKQSFKELLLYAKYRLMTLKDGDKK